MLQTETVYAFLTCVMHAVHIHSIKSFSIWWSKHKKTRKFILLVPFLLGHRCVLVFIVCSSDLGKDGRWPSYKLRLFCRPLTVEAQHRSRGSPYVICDVHSGTGRDILRVTWFFLWFSFHRCSTFTHVLSVPLGPGRAERWKERTVELSCQNFYQISDVDLIQRRVKLNVYSFVVKYRNVVFQTLRHFSL
jgi:hypothetical protein